MTTGMSAGKLKQALENRRGTAALEKLYGGRGGALTRQQARYRALLDRFDSIFPAADRPRLFSTPGRTEICGNHTDHNHGKVLAAAIDLDVIAAAAPDKGGRIVIESEGYPRQEMLVDDLAPRESERSTAAGITRGVAARMQALGYAVGGFSACVTSDVLKGSGLSSSASYEVLVAAILNHLFNQGAVSGQEIALVGQFSENEYFGKPSGLMDQTTCALGGFITIDFQDPSRPRVRGVKSAFSGSGYVPVVVDTGGSHADLTPEYAAVKEEMKAVAERLGGSFLRDTSREDLLSELPRLRAELGDRAVLRALHFFDDNDRVEAQVRALESGRYAEFLGLVRESGRSSWMLLQNCYPGGTPREQGVPVALALSQSLLGDEGAWRVHGGGFAGTILAFVPDGRLPAYLHRMRAVFGPESCHALSVRLEGAVMLDV
jgi:galactokinase